MTEMLSPLYQAADKTLFGPVTLPAGESGVIFEFYDTFTFQDWGKMPDSLPRKGEAQAVMAAEWFEALENPACWRRFSATSAALQLRKANPFGSIFNEVGEELQQGGLRTHYRGVLSAFPEKNQVLGLALTDLDRPTHRFVAQRVVARKPQLSPFLGEFLYDYFPTRDLSIPRVFPFDVVFQIQQAFPRFDFYTKYEHSRRIVHVSEALAMSGLSAAQLQSILLKSAWMASYLAAVWKDLGLTLSEGTLSWGVDAQGQLFLVGALGLENLQVSIEGLPLSKEFLLQHFYCKQPWYHSVEKAKKDLHWKSDLDWKKKVLIPPPLLSHELKEVGTQIYLTLAQELAARLSGRSWFPTSLPLSRLTQEMRRIHQRELASVAEGPAL